jgi:hypothetical protein
LRELLAKLPTPDKLLACASAQLDGILLAAICERIKRPQQDQTAPPNIELTAVQGIRRIDGRVTVTQRRNAHIATMAELFVGTFGVFRIPRPIKRSE